MDQGSFRLPNGQAASYEWGSYAVKLSPGLSLRKDTVASILAALSSMSSRRRLPANAGWKGVRRRRKLKGQPGGDSR
jgi:hypothetical protein